MFAGTISASGRGYRLTVRAVETTKGDTVTTASEEARSKSDVLQAVGRVAESMRRALGDAVPSDQLAAETFTAASLEAVKSYTIAQTLSWDRKNEEAITYYQRAIQEDKNFGRAYAGWAAAAYDWADHRHAHDSEVANPKHVSSPRFASSCVSRARSVNQIPVRSVIFRLEICLTEVFCSVARIRLGCPRPFSIGTFTRLPHSVQLPS